MKTFFAVFLVAVLALIPINYTLEKFGGIRIFSGDAVLMRDMNTLVGEQGVFWEQFGKTKRVNILVMGVNGTLTDTIMLVSYDLKNQKVDVISVPRDTYYERDGYTGPAQRKINAIYGSEGIVPMAEAVSDVLMGMPINNYVIVEYDDVEKIVDSMGGVPVNIPFDMDYDDPYDTPPLNIHFKEGPTTLNGSDSVKFLRYRKDDKAGYGYNQGDIGRVAAQQEFIKSAFKQALGFSLPKVAKTAMTSVESDLDVKTALKIATKAIGLDGEDMATWMIEGSSGTRNGASYWFYDEALVEQMLINIFTVVTQN